MLELQNESKRIINSLSLVLYGTVQKSQPIKEQCVHYFYQPIAKPEHEFCISRIDFLVILQS